LGCNGLDQGLHFPQLSYFKYFIQAILFIELFEGLEVALSSMATLFYGFHT
jgi:hypothetical protein